MQYFAAFESFDIFEEFNGVPGTYIKSFLISDIINLNKWQATHEANISNLSSFLGRPGIHYINPEDGKRDHTGAPSFDQSLQLQELYRVANIISVGSDIATRKNWQVSKMMDESVTAKIKSGEIKWISPSIWPEPNSVETIEQTDGTTIDVVHDYKGLHYAFVDEPAYGDDADIKSFCDGTTKACQLELAKFNAAIDNVEPLTEHPIKLPKRKDSSNTKWNTSDNSNTSNRETMTTVEELQKELEDTKKALKATEEELKKEQEARKATEEETEKKDQEARKATDEEMKKDDEEKTALKARIEFLEKVPVVNEIIQSHLSAKLITSDKESEFRASLEKESIEQLKARLETSKSFEAKIKTTSTTEYGNASASYYGSVDGSFDSSTGDMDDEALLMEAVS